MPDRDRQEIVRGLTNQQSHDAQHPEDVLLEQLLQALTNRQCEQAQTLVDQVQATAGNAPNVSRGLDQAAIGACFADTQRFDEAAAMLERLKTMDAPDRREAVRMLEQVITEAKAAPAAATPGATR